MKLKIILKQKAFVTKYQYFYVKFDYSIHSKRGNYIECKFTVYTVYKNTYGISFRFNWKLISSSNSMKTYYEVYYHLRH